jgi:crotonobetainyl-CoA:carnitine CoA-transferase CaiB-like acyl-CoA transferase
VTSIAGPLNGVRILAVEQFGAGPFGSLVLTGLGADVIKIEQPGDGDVARRTGPFFHDGIDPGSGNLYFQALNAGKRSITLDLTSPAGQDVLHRLLHRVDAVCSNLRGDVVSRLGLTYGQLASSRPEIVCGHLTAYGRDGPRAAWPGYDYVMQAEAGYCSLTGEPGDPPTRFGISIVDWMGGLALATGLLAGIVNAKATGRGGDADVSLFDIALFNLNYLGAWWMNAGYVPGRVPRGSHPSQIPSQMFRTRDGWIMIMAGAKDKFWRELCRNIGRPEWISDPRFATAADRLANRAVLSDAIDAVLIEHDTAYWLEQLQGKVPVGPVLTVAQALATPFVEESGAIIQADATPGKPLKTIAMPIRWQGERASPQIAPQLGAHTRGLLEEAGYSDAEIDGLAAAGTI